MAYAQAKKLDSNIIPVIDIAPLRDGSGAVSVAKKLHSASQSLGFIYVSGHGIPEASINALRDLALDFFRSSSEHKQSVKISENHRGWLAAGGAKMGDKQKADLKESFIWVMQGVDNNTLTDHPLRGKNQWPHFMPELETAAMDYFQQGLWCWTFVHHKGNQFPPL